MEKTRRLQIKGNMLHGLTDGGGGATLKSPNRETRRRTGAQASKVDKKI